MGKIKTPLIIVNFKAYASATGKNAIEMAKICEKVAQDSEITISIAVQPTDICCVTKTVSIPVLAQHVDAVTEGAFTGSVLVDSIKHAGAIGSLVNHSEKPIDLSMIKKTIQRLHSESLLAIACAGSSHMAAEISKFNPDFIAIEPPELIGGLIAVSQSKPEIITSTTSHVKRMPVLCGAGIHSKNDVIKAIQLGAKGILVASGVVCAKNPETALRELVEGFDEKKGPCAPF